MCLPNQALLGTEALAAGISALLRSSALRAGPLRASAGACCGEHFLGKSRVLGATPGTSRLLPEAAQAREAGPARLLGWGGGFRSTAARGASGWSLGVAQGRCPWVEVPPGWSASEPSAVSFHSSQAEGCLGKGLCPNPWI